MVEHDISQNERLYLPAYTFADAGRFAKTSSQNVRNWFRGASAPGHAMHPLFGETPEFGLSYIQLVEVAFVAAMRRKGLHLKVLRKAYSYVREQLQVSYPFAHEEFRQLGMSLFLDALRDGASLLEATNYGQLGMRGILEELMDQLDYDDSIAARWYLRGKEHPILINPRVSFGRPIIDGTGIPTRTIASRNRAGDSIEFLAYDFNLTLKQVEEALWFENSLRSA